MGAPPAAVGADQLTASPPGTEETVTERGEPGAAGATPDGPLPDPDPDDPDPDDPDPDDPDPDDPDDPDPDDPAAAAVIVVEASRAGAT